MPWAADLLVSYQEEMEIIQPQGLSSSIYLWACEIANILYLT